MKKKCGTKGQVTAILGAAALLCAVTGCGKTDGNAEADAGDAVRLEAPAEDEGQTPPEQGTAEEEKETAQGSQQPEEGDGEKQENGDSKEQENSPKTGGDTEWQEIESDTELDGIVKSVGENSMVVNRIHNYVEQNGGTAAVAIAVEGSEDSELELITVYFSENTRFIVRTVKNGGVNGDADAEDEDGSISSIQENNNVKMTGSYEGADFHAESVVIYHFV